MKKVDGSSGITIEDPRTYPQETKADEKITTLYEVTIGRVLEHPKTIEILSKLPGLVVIARDDDTPTAERNFGRVEKHTIGLVMSSIGKVAVKMADVAEKTPIDKNKESLLALENEKMVYGRLRGVVGIPNVYKLSKGSELYIDWLDGNRLDEKYAHGGLSFDEAQELLKLSSKTFQEAKKRGVTMYGIESHNIMQVGNQENLSIKDIRFFDRAFDRVNEQPLKQYAHLSQKEFEGSAVLVTTNTICELAIGVNEVRMKRISLVHEELGFYNFLEKELRARGFSKSAALSLAEVASGRKIMNFNEFSAFINSFK